MGIASGLGQGLGGVIGAEVANRVQSQQAKPEQSKQEEERKLREEALSQSPPSVREKASTPARGEAARKARQGLFDPAQPLSWWQELALARERDALPAGNRELDGGRGRASLQNSRDAGFGRSSQPSRGQAPARQLARQGLGDPPGGDPPPPTPFGRDAGLGDPRVPAAWHPANPSNRWRIRGGQQSNGSGLLAPTLLPPLAKAGDQNNKKDEPCSREAASQSPSSLLEQRNNLRKFRFQGREYDRGGPIEGPAIEYPEAAMALGALADVANLGAEVVVDTASLLGSAATSASKFTKDLLLTSPVFSGEPKSNHLKQTPSGRKSVERHEAVGGLDHVKNVIKEAGRNYVSSMEKRFERSQEEYAKGNYFKAGMLGNPARPAIEVGAVVQGGLGGVKLALSATKGLVNAGSRVAIPILKGSTRSNPSKLHPSAQREIIDRWRTAAEKLGGGTEPQVVICGASRSSMRLPGWDEFRARSVPLGEDIAPVSRQQRIRDTLTEKIYRNPHEEGPILHQYSAGDRIQHEALKTQLRQQMQRPVVQDARLEGLLKRLYRQEGLVGSGSTADAVRFELATGQPVRGCLHSQKARDFLGPLEKWLKANPMAAASDRAAAENVIQDLREALGGKPWYSATMIPR